MCATNLGWATSWPNSTENTNCWPQLVAEKGFTPTPPPKKNQSIPVKNKNMDKCRWACFFQIFGDQAKTMSKVSHWILDLSWTCALTGAQWGRDELWDDESKVCGARWFWHALILSSSTTTYKAYPAFSIDCQASCCQAEQECYDFCHHPDDGEGKENEGYNQHGATLGERRTLSKTHAQN